MQARRGVSVPPFSQSLNDIWGTRTALLALLLLGVSEGEAIEEGRQREVLQRVALVEDGRSLEQHPGPLCVPTRSSETDVTLKCITSRSAKTEHALARTLETEGWKCFCSSTSSHVQLLSAFAYSGSLCTVEGMDVEWVSECLTLL